LRKYFREGSDELKNNGVNVNIRLPVYGREPVPGGRLICIV
jgi:hypothetical protein